jgi:hypothetical protein
MRLTADYDTHRYKTICVAKMLIGTLRGIYLTGKLPSEVKRSPSGRGFHTTWRGLSISESQSLTYRKVIYDDPRRIAFDMRHGSKRKEKQILFFRKSYKLLMPNGEERTFKSKLMLLKALRERGNELPHPNEPPVGAT